MKYLLVILTAAPLTFIEAQTTVTVVLHEKTGYEGYEEFADRAAQKLQDVLNSEAFRTELLTLRVTETNGLTNQQIYELIMNAHETQGPGGMDKVVDLRVRTMSPDVDGKKWMRWCRPGSRVGTIGKDGGTSGIVATCPQRLKLWYDNAEVSELTGHYAHEFMHLIGFSHYGKKSSSVVYQVGNLVSRLAE